MLDVNSDLQQNGLQTYLNFNRSTAARYGFAPNQIDNVLYDAFGQRTVSTIYNALNQYFVVMEVAPEYWQYPQTLDQIYLSTAAGNATGTAQHANAGRHGLGRDGGERGQRRVEQFEQHQHAELECGRQRRPPTASANSKGGSSSGSADSTSAETMVPLPALLALHQQPHGDPGEPSERTGGRDDLVQPAAGGSLSKAGEDDQRRRSARSACRPTSTVRSRAPRRLTRSRWAPSRC